MTEVSVFGLPALAFEIGIMVLAALPIWLAAKAVGAGKATLLRAVMAMMLGTVASLAGGALGAAILGGLGILLAPIAFLLTFKYVLETSFFGAIILSVIAAAIYMAMGFLIGSGISVH
jgi:hypothetical protein